MQHEEKYRTSIAEQSKYRRAFAWAAATPVVSARSTGSPLLLSQPPDVVLTILMQLDAVGLSRAASSCRQLRHFVHQHAGPLWRNRLEAEGIALTAPRQSPTDWRWLYWRLSGTLEVRGDGQGHIFTPGFGDNLHANRQASVGTADSNDRNGPSREIERRGIGKQCRWQHFVERFPPGQVFRCCVFVDGAKQYII